MPADVVLITNEAALVPHAQKERHAAHSSLHRGARLSLCQRHPRLDHGRPRDPEAADRWSWLMAGAYWQLWLGRSIVSDVRLPGRSREKSGAIPSGWQHDAVPPWRRVPAELVCQIRAGNLDGGRWLRQPATVLRRRPDRSPSQCGIEQLQSNPTRTYVLLLTRGCLPIPRGRRSQTAELGRTAGEYFAR